MGRGRTVVLIGADGSGKTTFAKRLCAELSPRARYVYLGSNPSAATHSLPTTRAWIRIKVLLGRDVHRSGPPEPGACRIRPGSRLRRAALHAKSLVSLALRVSEDAYRFLVVEALRRRGHLLLLDRHPFPDYYADRVTGRRGWRRWGDRIHGFLLEHAYPRPDAVVLLDAPAEVLLARKNEGTIEAIEARRREYREIARQLGPTVEVDVRRSEEEVIETLRHAIAESESVESPSGLPPSQLPAGAPR